MKYARVSLLAAIAGILFATNPGAQAEEQATTKEPSYVMATYAVPDLDKKLARKLSRSIAKEPGLVSAKTDLEKKTFSVTFLKKETSSKTMLAALSKRAPNATLQGEAPVEATPSKAGCAGCPSRGSCPSQGKK